ncbi:MAG: PDZ domain-containing protein [Sporolactobacillus sp.]
MADILRTVAQGLLTFFMNPLLYLLLAGLILFSAQRVKRERRSFHIKAYGMFNTIFRSLLPSLAAGAAASLILVGLGVTLQPGIFVLLSIGYLVTMLPGQLRFLSPALSGGLTVLTAYFLPSFATPYPLLNQWLVQIRSVSFQSLGVFLSVAVLSEALLVLWCGSRQTSPRLIRSRRGGVVGAHEASQLWIAPMAVLIPSGALSAHGIWPFLPHTAATFGLLIFPVGIGFAQLVTHTLPQRAIHLTAAYLIASATLMIAATALTIWLKLPLILVGAALAAMCIRLWIVYYAHRLRKLRPFYFTEPNQGVRVVGVIPHSPAAAMAVCPGEEIVAVNDQKITNEYEFYEALQTQPAYCKLFVIDRFGEPRIAKGPVHDGDGHRMGLLFLESDRLKNLSAKTEA